MKQPKIRLLEDRVLVLPMPEVRKTASGILLPGGQVKEYPIMATVIAVGPELEERLMPGEVIYYRFGEGLEIELEGEKYIVIRESGILVVNEPRAIDAFEAMTIVRGLAEWSLQPRGADVSRPLRIMNDAINLVYPKYPG